MKRQHITNSHIPGLQFDKEKSAYSFSPQQLPASEHFFRSNTFMAQIEGGEIHFLFGQKSLFEKRQSNLKAAIEISMPIKMASIFLYEIVYMRPSLAGDKTFNEALTEHISKTSVASNQYECSLDLPLDSGLYRAFSSNYCNVALSHGQAMFEFFEANPSLIAHLSNGKPTRERDGLKPVIAIITPPEMMQDFLEKTKSLLAPYINQNGEIYELDSES